MQRLADNVKKALRTHSKDDWLRQDTDGTVVFSDLSTVAVQKALSDARRADADARAKGEVARAMEGIKPPISRADREAISRLRNFFFQVRSRRALARDDAGSEVDVASFIERQTGRTQIPVFKLDVRGRGFKALVLIDRSGSMEGQKSVQAERTCRLITRALSFPFVNLKVWGFQSKALGQADITRFDPKLDVYTTDSTLPGGSTPLHLAIRMALRELQEGAEDKQLFVVTDGIPTYKRKNGSIVSAAVMMDQIRSDVQKARSKGVGVTGVMISQMDEDRWMAHMFGKPEFWRIVTPKTLGTDLFELVVSSFERYLRNG